jgi:cation transport protein ChaC
MLSWQLTGEWGKTFVEPEGCPEFPAGDLWVFGYGSLMWRPDFEFSESAPAKIFGFHRGLCLWSVLHRGTRENPGLVFGLATGGSCVGRAFRVARKNRSDVLSYLWQREMMNRAYIPTRVRIHMQGKRRAGLAFVVDTGHVQYAGRLSDREMACIVTRGRGRSGRNIDYFRDCLGKFKDMGVSVRQYSGIESHMSKISADAAKR